MCTSSIPNTYIFWALNSVARFSFFFLFLQKNVAYFLLLHSKLTALRTRRAGHPICASALSLEIECVCACFCILNIARRTRALEQKRKYMRWRATCAWKFARILRMDCKAQNCALHALFGRVIFNWARSNCLRIDIFIARKYTATTTTTFLLNSPTPPPPPPHIIPPERIYKVRGARNIQRQRHRTAAHLKIYSLVAIRLLALFLQKKPILMLFYDFNSIYQSILFTRY